MSQLKSIPNRFFIIASPQHVMMLQIQTESSTVSTYSSKHSPCTNLLFIWKEVCLDVSVGYVRSDYATNETSNHFLMLLHISWCECCLTFLDVNIVLHCRFVKVNGVRLMMPTDRSMPQIVPNILAAGNSVKLPPTTMAFFVFPDASIELCQESHAHH